MRRRASREGPAIGTARGRSSRQAKGLITINSSSGIVALEAGVPVIALGKSIYGMKDLVTGAAGPGPLDILAQSPPPRGSSPRRSCAFSSAIT